MRGKKWGKEVLFNLFKLPTAIKLQLDLCEVRTFFQGGTVEEDDLISVLLLSEKCNHLHVQYPHWGNNAEILAVNEEISVQTTS